MHKYLILNCDDFGQSQAANEAIIQLLEEGKVSSATIMPPAPAFHEAAKWTRKRGKDRVGLHLTFTSEFEGYRWSSLTGSPSLEDTDGFLHKTVRDFETLADPKSVKAEMITQFEAVKREGIAITHVDNHMGSLYGLAAGRSYLPLILWQCSRRKLPFRLFRYIYEQDPLIAGIPQIREKLAKIVLVADLLGVAVPDYLLSHPYQVQEGETYESFKKSMIGKLYELPEGISETFIHPAVDHAEMRNLIPSWEKRVWEYQLMLDQDFDYARQDAGVQLTSYLEVKRKMIRPRWGSLSRYRSARHS